jgi:carboxypeptidase T
MFRSFILIAFFMAASRMAFSNEAPQMHWVHLKLSNLSARALVSSTIHIDQMIEDSGYSVVNQDDFNRLKKLVPNLIVDTHPIFLPKAIKGEEKDVEFPRGDEAFHTYTEVVSELQRFVQDHSDIASLFVAGKTVEGTDIVGIRITGARDEGAFVPGVMFIGSHHAREHLSTEVPMLVIKHLLDSYDHDATIQRLIDGRDLYFIPMLNVDGAMYDITGRNYKMWRKNRVPNSGGSYGVDLNRNYAFGWGTGGSSRSQTSDVYMGPTPFSEPETQAVKQFVETHGNIRAMLSFHTYSELILYPWGKSYDGIGGRDQQVFEKMATTMSKWNGYKPQQASDLYIASGDTCDWAYGEHSIFCFTFELSPKSAWSGGFYPGASMIQTAFRANLQPVLYLIDKAADPYGVLEPELGL